MSKIIVLIGAPGVGKGTQARLLEARLGIPQISTGDMFREMKSSDTPLAREVQEIMASGKLVPDALTYEMVRERTARPDCHGTFTLDGFPRTAVQAEMLESLSEELGKPVVAILVDVPTEVLEKRLTGRRSCPVCGEIYNVYFKPPKKEGFCDLHPEAELVQRSDDTEEKVSVRLETYEENTKPLLDYYRNSGRLETVDGSRDSEKIYKELESLIGSANATV
ncbi:MAG TPA: adenylate kinase [Aridibacter sp.]|nr:adenylate kinase [Aridibacter sp.]